MNRRLGRFTLSSNLVEDNYPEIAAFLSEIGFVPTKVELLYHRMAFEYFGISSRFREVDIGEEIPEYELIINRTEEGDLSVEVVEL